jgi:DNA mismatch repair protein MutS
VFRRGFSAEIDELTVLSTEGKDFLLALEQREKERTGIHNLKIRYNRVFGYAIEISKSQLGRIPEDYVRRQTLANAERFVTEELKRYEEKVLNADERRLALEEATFIEMRAQLLEHCIALRNTAQALAEIDALLSLAAVAADGDWVQPEMGHEPTSLLQAARHPVVEAFVKARGEAYVPCDVAFDDQAKLLLVTGPNMAGKSTVLRAVALIHVLAQMGSFVPARRARIGLCDRIFTRVGASDNLSQGQSTFMVEMAETATILNAATARSLVVVDEIGRGTSTADGLSIAWSVAEYLHDVARSRALFATHYHELVELPVTLERVKNFHMAVSEFQGQVVFLRELRPGGASRSYGIEVARLAGLPKGVLVRARELLDRLEAGASAARGPAVQLQLFVPSGEKASPIVRRLKALDVEQMTPMQAMNTLSELIADARKT